MSFHVIDAAGKLPQLEVAADFTNDPTNVTRVWTDITTDVRSLSYTVAGRNNELQRTVPGTLQAVFDNRAGNYDSGNTAGAYYPGVKRMRWIRVRSQWAGVVYPRWQGLIELWKQEWPDSGRDAVVSVTATDAIKVLNLFDLTGLSFGSELTSARVTNVCTAAGLPSTVSTGATTVVADGPFAAASMALNHLQQIEETENGLIFADAAGSIIFHDRHYRLLNSATPVGTIGDGPGEIPYRTAEYDLSDADIFNAAAVTPSGGTPEVASDTASQAAHYTRTLTRSLLTSSQPEALSAAQYLVGRYKDPKPRVPTVELLGIRDTTKWPVILGAVNSNRFTWKRRAAASTISTDVYVEQVAETVMPGSSWKTVFQLSPAIDEAGWVLGSAVNSLLGMSTILIY